ncbi:MAG: RNA-directed DNA polymerase [Verrucomicrobiales bacterium]|nr:RNA-directed DNA polymerase [Verrucomicrobiales bacterium]
MADVAAWANLRAASRQAARGKRRRPDVETWLLREETELRQLREELRQGSYKPGRYQFFVIHEPKRREIAAAPFRDRVVHHALCRWMAPVLQSRFIARSFSCQVGKGTTAARECCRRLTNQFPYVLKCDVRKFYPSMDHALLLGQLEGVSRCPQVSALTRSIVDSYHSGPDAPVELFPGDDWVTAFARPRGLPIGNLTSQLWGNFYLDALDHWITEAQRHGAYLRYTDDFLLFGEDKERLWDLRSGIVTGLTALRLKLAEPKSRLLATREGVPFCGFRFLPGARPRIMGATKRRFERRRRELARSRKLSRLTQSVFAWYQFSREANSEGLRRAYARRAVGVRRVGQAQPSGRRTGRAEQEPMLAHPL